MIRRQTTIGCDIINILFTIFSQLVCMGTFIPACFDLASEFNPASIWVVSYIRGRELVESNNTTFTLSLF